MNKPVNGMPAGASPPKPRRWRCSKGHTFTALEPVITFRQFGDKPDAPTLAFRHCPMCWVELIAGLAELEEVEAGETT